MKIGEAVRYRIFDLCEQRDLSINRLSLLSGLTQSTLNNIVSGRNKGTSVITLKKICDGLEITIQDFFDSPLFENLDDELK